MPNNWPRRGAELASGRRNGRTKGPKSFFYSLKIALPLPSVGWARDGPHAQPVVGGVAAGIAGDNYMVARFERVLLNSLTAQLAGGAPLGGRSEEHTSELQSQSNLVCRLLLEKKKKP